MLLLLCVEDFQSWDSPYFSEIILWETHSPRADCDILPSIKLMKTN